MAEEISNRLIAMLLIVALVASVGGTFISLHRIAAIGGYDATGFVITQTGIANLSIQAYLSIVINDTGDEVQFGACQVYSGSYLTIDTSTLTASSTNCSGLTTQAVLDGMELSLTNDGNQDANVTISSNSTANGTFIAGRFPAFKYKTDNGTGNPGCFKGLGAVNPLVTSYTNFSLPNVKYKGCENLTWRAQYASTDTCTSGLSTDRCTFDTEFEIGIPTDAVPGMYTSTITFSAVDANTVV